MHEAVTHQAAGLSGLTPQVSPRIVALASHGDRRSELPLLWQLCATWTAMDYPVVVLDGTVSESAQTPGLAQLLQDADDLSALTLTTSPGGWPIVPAARGLAQLRHPQRPHIEETAKRAQQLVELFHSYELILLYAPARDLATLLPGSDLAPLIPVSTHEPALLTAYQALKQVVNLGKLRPTIVAVVDDPAQAGRDTGHRVGKNLQDCAQDFLTREVPALTICPDRSDDVQRLAMRAVESALQPPRSDASFATIGDAPAMRKH